jgi:pimeloyl-ACP methyl ester carboxylesterase
VNPSPDSPPSHRSHSPIHSPIAFFLVNGINTFPGSSKNWNGRGVTWLHIHKPEFPRKAEKIEYLCGPIGRAFGQRMRAHKLYKTIIRYHLILDELKVAGDWERVVVGHSNGAAVILAMLRDYPCWPVIDHLHLVCGACEADFEKNGLNQWLAAGRIRRVTVYVAGRDMMLRLAHTWPARLLGYGVLGLHGAVNVDRAFLENGRVREIRTAPWCNYGHSDCWSDQNFDATMRQFVV